MARRRPGHIDGRHGFHNTGSVGRGAVSTAAVSRSASKSRAAKNTFPCDEPPQSRIIFGIGESARGTAKFQLKFLLKRLNQVRDNAGHHDAKIIDSDPPQSVVSYFGESENGTEPSPTETRIIEGLMEMPEPQKVVDNLRSWMEITLHPHHAIQPVNILTQIVRQLGEAQNDERLQILFALHLREMDRGSDEEKRAIGSVQGVVGESLIQYYIQILRALDHQRTLKNQKKRDILSRRDEEHALRGYYEPDTILLYPDSSQGTVVQMTTREDMKGAMGCWRREETEQRKAWAKLCTEAFKEARNDRRNALQVPEVHFNASKS